MADAKFKEGILAAVDRLTKLGEHNAAAKLRDSFARVLGEL